VLLAVVVYFGAVAAHAIGVRELEAFGSNWALDGFCLSFKDSALFHTHLLCFYADAAFAAVLFGLTRGVSRPELLDARNAIFSTFAHGCGHVYLLHATPEGQQPLMEQYPTPAEIALMLSGFFTFFSAFIYLHSRNPSALDLIQSAFHSYALAAWVPPLYLFTYVNTVLFFNLTGRRLMGTPRGEKDVFYDLEALLVSLPVAVVTWLEPLLCDAFLVRYGGHVWFDVSIPAGATLYLLLARRLPPRGATTASRASSSSHHLKAT
jgi:hypothetical protein